MEWVYATYQGIDHSVLDLDGAQTIAHNIRSKEDAILMAAAPRMAEALKTIQAIGVLSVETGAYMAPVHARLLGQIRAKATIALQELDDD